MIPYTLLDDDDFVLSVGFSESADIPENALIQVTSDKFLKPRFNRDNLTFYEGASTEEVMTDKIARATVIDEHYTNLIFDIQKKHLGKIAFNPGYQIPQIAIDEVNSLRAECNQKIFDETGLTTYQYRESNPKLATIDL